MTETLTITGATPRHGKLTTDHSASSYGIAVLLIDGCADALGPMDLIPGTMTHAYCYVAMAAGVTTGHGSDMARKFAEQGLLLDPANQEV
jgi:hypothetical protein